MLENSYYKIFDIHCNIILENISKRLGSFEAKYLLQSYMTIACSKSWL